MGIQNIVTDQDTELLDAEIDEFSISMSAQHNFSCANEGDLESLIGMAMKLGEMRERKKWQEKVSTIPDGFVLVPKSDIHDHYVAEHLKGTTCSVDVSELTGNFGDRIYGKLRPYDCIGSDGNTLLYDLESSNFSLQRRAGNSGEFILLNKECSDEMAEVIAGVARVCGGGADDIYNAIVKQAMVEVLVCLKDIGG